MYPSQNSLVFMNVVIKSLLKWFLSFLLHFGQLNIANTSLIFMYSRQDLQFVNLLL